MSQPTERPGPTTGATRSAENSGTELRQRIISALALGVAALAALLSGPVAFSLLVAVIGGIMSWEWGRVVRGSDRDVAHFVHCGSVLAAVLLTVFGLTGPAVVALAIGAFVVGALQVRLRPWLSLAGVFYVGLPAIAFVWLRGDNGHGVAAVLFVFACVWAHDSFAMLVGKAIGGPRLWPSLSPNKTWSGFAGGLVAAAAAGAVFAVFLGPPAGVGRLALVGLCLGLAAFAGDMLESALKRRYGLKNASNLIPGHGGFLDRMDGIVIATIVAVAVALSANFVSPASGLLFLH
ncbi:MAG: phosphatidate cytidylyltransferase [Hyphomicrobiaceae bacterium]|nr:phosphatidate cytidylyltransferase [Hyphomicrobiaceae bacterium]